MNFKKIFAVLLAAVLCMSLFACNPVTPTEKETEKQTEAPTEKQTDATTEEELEDVTLRMAWWGSQNRHDRTIAVIELYESIHPNIHIEYEFYDFNGYFDKLATLVAANDVWDIFQMGSNFPTYASKIEYLNKYIEDGTIDVSGTSEAFLRICADAEGNQAGLCSGINTYGIAYDPAIFAECGIAEPTENWTWEEFEAACLKIHEVKGIYGFSKFDDWQAGCRLLIGQTAGNDFYKLDNSGLGFDDYKLLVPFIQMRIDLVEAGAYPDEGALNEISDIENDFLVTGEAAMTWVASNQFKALAEAAGRELKLINPPKLTADGPAGISVQSSQMLCVSSDSENPAEAAKFIAYFQSDITANLILAAERGIPTFYAVRDALQPTLDSNTRKVYDYVDLVGNLPTGGDRINPIDPACTDENKNQYLYLIAKAVAGDMTADECAKEFYDFAASREY